MWDFKNPTFYDHTTQPLPQSHNSALKLSVRWHAMPELDFTDCMAAAISFASLPALDKITPPGSRKEYARNSYIQMQYSTPSANTTGKGNKELKSLRKARPLNSVFKAITMSLLVWK
ncbi:hypothetical protein V6N11_061249 [Hibiscus sabdariffa]|uniref:Uncharacterized protein n=1 Tax=Hibiscus sabdariffa TaxID=183260 RepID=A0ABR2NV54_9ROSI